MFKGEAHNVRLKTRPLSLVEYLKGLYPAFDSKKIPSWPPDVFGLALSCLLKSAAYGAVLNRWPPAFTGASWAAHAVSVGVGWRTGWAKERVPVDALKCWKNAFKHLDFPITELGSRPEQTSALLELVAFADEACTGLGIPVQMELSVEEEEFLAFGDDLLADSKSQGASLCREIDCSRLRVLPKAHCPQAGLTIRSFSRNLSLYVGNEITPVWHARNLDAEAAINLLIVPWPPVVKPMQFSPCPALPGELQNMDSTAFRFFALDLAAGESTSVCASILATLKSSEEFIGKIHGVVLPELALTSEAHDLLCEQLLKQDVFLVSGVGSSKTAVGHARNEVRATFPTFETVTQQKHHRWKLNESQIIQYGLGSRLAPNIEWWEHICVENRTLGFYSVLPWLLTTVLICEDLARPDPVGDLVRSVGPNLVIALLMDGPQLKERWSARYATTLADDPGCSVLSLTSLGMAKLSRPRGSSASSSRVVAIWKDATGGGPVQIEMPDGYDGVILSLSRQDIEEWTADGRCSTAGYPVLTGVHPIKRSV